MAFIHSTMFEANGLIFPSTRKHNFYNISYVTLCSPQEYHSISWSEVQTIVSAWLHLFNIDGLCLDCLVLSSLA